MINKSWRPVGLSTSALLVALSGCSLLLTDQDEVTPPATYQAYIVDVSGSTVTSGAVDGYADRAERLIDQAPDGTTITVIVADGSALTSVCIPRSVELRGEGPNRVQRQDDLAAKRTAAAAMFAEQLACGRRRAISGSDLVGAIMNADRMAPAAVVASGVTVFTDGLQSSPDFHLTRKVLGDPAAITAAVVRLKKQGLVPTRLPGGVLKITDPAVGAKLTAAQAEAVITFWSDYAGAAGMTLTI